MPAEEFESNIAQKFSQLSFSAEQYVNGVVLKSHTVEKILQEKQEVLHLQEQTSQQLKKNVYDNYKQFIDTAKEIAYVASEMHQLREMLTRQEQLLHSMTDLSIVQHKGHKPNELPSELDLRHDVVDSGTGNEEGLKKTENLSFLLERVEGSARLLDGNEKSLLKEAEAVLNDKSDTVKVLLCLLTDSLLIADCLPVKRGTLQYRLRWAFELDSVAAVDGQLALQMKLLVFPQTILLQMESVQEKSSWMEAIRIAKYQKLTRQAVNNARLHYPSLGLAMDQTDSVEEDVQLPDWLLEAPDDLDVCIAERNFKEAVSLLQKIQEYWPSLEGYSSSSARDVKLRIDNRQEQLIKVLCDELRGSTVQCGPRAAKKAVGLLIELNQTSIASQLFLEHREALLRSATKNQSQHSEGAMNIYAKRICSVFFSHLAETGRQFQKAFVPTDPAISSALVCWCCSQINWFVNLLSKQLFSPQTPLSVIAEAVQLCTQACGQLQDIGLDLGFVLRRSLRKEIERCIIDGKDKLLEATKHRSSEDAWKPQKIDNNWQQQSLTSRFGIALGQYIYDENMTYLTSNSIAFAKSFLQFVNDVICLYSPPLHRLIADSVCETLTAHRRHIEVSLAGTKLKSDQKFIQRNESFLLNDVAQATERICSSDGLLLWPDIKIAFENQHKF